MTKQAILTEAAPKPIGPYSQAIRVQNTVYLSGVIPLSPEASEITTPDFSAQAAQVLNNLQAVCQASGGRVDQIVKLTVYLTDLGQFPILNDMMMRVFNAPYPARTTIEVSKLPKNALIEIDAILVLV